MKATRLALLLFVLPCCALASIDLTPRYIDTFIDGIHFRRLYFADGEKKITLRVNRETVASPEGAGVLFRFTKLPDATFQILRSRHSPEEAFEGLSLERYRESARRLLPVRARETVIREEVADPLPVNDWKCYRLILACDIGGAAYVQSVTFLNLSESDQIALITLAPEKQFEDAAARSFQIIRTWQELLPGDERPATSN